ncbi:LacI family DNA-binding transcriptional regulator, partial [Thermosphaera sp.]
MADIAREAGVSIFTVSCALRGRRGVSDATARRVRALAERLGYQMDGAARLLAMRRRRVRSVANAPAIALWRLGPDTHAERIRHMDQHLAIYCRSQGFLLHCIRSDEFPSLEAMGRALYARGIEGLILVANAISPEVSPAEWEAFPWHRFSLVKVSRGAAALRCPIVAADPSEMMRGALERACAAGAQRMLVLLVRATASPRDDFDRWGTVAAFRALRAAGQQIELADFDSVEATPTSVLRDLVRRFQPDMIIGFPAGWILVLERAGYC